VSDGIAEGLRYEVAGAGPPLLLIHEGIGDRSMWDRQWERWRERFTLIRYDQRGFGDSDDPDGEYSLHGDALAVLDAAGAERAAVVGASMGGAAAVDLALAAPDRVRALVAVVATPSGWSHSDEHLAGFAEVEAAYERGGLAAANEAELRMWVDGAGREPGDVDPAVRGAFARMNLAALEREEARERAGTEIEPLALDPPAIGRLGELRLPTLVVTGELDRPSVNAGAAALAAGVRDAQRVEIAATAHAPFLERPDEFDAAVLPFLSPASSA
jgi:pimeloyl-ACP methyl ester carboxylesterase